MFMLGYFVSSGVAVVGLTAMEVVPKHMVGSAHGMACAIAQGTNAYCDKCSLLEVILPPELVVMHSRHESLCIFCINSGSICGRLAIHAGAGEVRLECCVWGCGAVPGSHGHPLIISSFLIGQSIF